MTTTPIAAGPLDVTVRLRTVPATGEASRVMEEAAIEIEELRARCERWRNARREALEEVRAELVEIGLLPEERGWIEHGGKRDPLTLAAEIMFLRESKSPPNAQVVRREAAGGASERTEG